MVAFYILFTIALILFFGATIINLTPSIKEKHGDLAPILTILGFVCLLCMGLIINTI